MCGKVLQLESVTQQRLGAATFQAEFVWPVIHVRMWAAAFNLPNPAQPLFFPALIPYRSIN